MSRIRAVLDRTIHEIAKSIRPPAVRLSSTKVFDVLLNDGANSRHSLTMASSQGLLSIERKGQIFILTLQNGEDNELNLALSKQILAALDHIQEQLDSESEGALIVQGNNAKFFCNVSSIPKPLVSLR